MPRSRRHRPAARRGVVSVVLALSLALLLGVSAIVVDIGYVTWARAQLQAAVDAASHAGAVHLDATDAGLVAARAAAVAAASFNDADGTPVFVDATADVILGRWDRSAGTFTPGGTALEVNAVRVTTDRTDLPAWFSQAAFGTTALATGATATAIRSPTGAGEVRCFLPLAVPACVIEDVHTGGTIQFVDLVLNPPGVNNVAWAREGTNPSASWLSNQINDCEQGGDLDAGDTVNLSNGIDTSVLQDLADHVEASTTTWQSALWGAIPPQDARSAIAASAYGHTLEGPIAVFEDDTYCTNPGAMTTNEVVTGFVWGSIYEVIATGPAAGKNIRMRLDLTLDRPMGTLDGGTNYGVEFIALSLVQ